MVNIDRKTGFNYDEYYRQNRIIALEKNRAKLRTKIKEIQTLLSETDERIRLEKER